MLDFPRPNEFAAEGAVHLLFFLRRYCAKLLYEIEFHQAPRRAPAAARYVELLGDALKIDPSPTDYLRDLDGEFYATCYLRAVGVRGAADAVPARGVRPRLVPAPRGRARCCGSCGRSARRRRRTSC